MARALSFHTTRFPAISIFAALAAATVLGGVIALEKSAGASLVATAVTIDLVLLIPALHYLLVVRAKGLPVITVIPVFRLSLALAGYVLPADERVLYDLVAHLARPAELIMVGYVLYRLHLGWSAFRAADTNDVLDRCRAGVRSMLPPTVPALDRSADAIAFEVALASYATRGWRSQPEFPAGATAFTGHRRSGYVGVVVGILLIVAVEVVVIHVLVSLWSVTAAWIMTGLSVYGAVWIVGDLHAVRLRPSWVAEDRLCMRLGLRGALTVPRHLVKGARQLPRSESVEDVLRLSLPHAPRVLIELTEPATSVGVYGLRKTVTAIELGVDDPDEFLKCLQHDG